MSDEHLFTGLLGEVRLVYDKEKRTIVPHPGLEARWDQIGPIPTDPELEERLARVAAYAEDECKRLDAADLVQTDDQVTYRDARGQEVEVRLLPEAKTLVLATEYDTQLTRRAEAGQGKWYHEICSQAEPAVDLGPEPAMHEYRFDAQATVCLRVRAQSREHAERVVVLLESSDPGDMERLGVELVEISVEDRELYQVDGVDVDDGEPLSGERHWAGLDLSGLDLGDVVREAVITTVRPDQCVIPMVGPMSSGIEPAYNRRCGPATVWHAGHEPRQELDGDALIKAIGDGVLGAGELTHDERLIWHEYLQRSALSVYEGRVRLDRARYEGKVELDSVDE